MKKGSKFLIGIAAAALTFGSLMATLGPDKFASHCSHHKNYHHCGHYQSTCHNQR